MDEMAGLELQQTQMFHNSARFLLIVPVTVYIILSMGFINNL